MFWLKNKVTRAEWYVKNIKACEPYQSWHKLNYFSVIIRQEL